MSLKTEHAPVDCDSYLTAEYGISRISEYDLKAVDFASPMAGRKLNGGVIKEIEVESEGSCQIDLLAL